MTETTLDPMMCPKVLCKCGRMVRVHPETQALFKHYPGKTHPSLKGGNSRKNRKIEWCPEVR